MKIGGMQKLTLLDYPEKMACIIFFDGCNFRCPFCHNASLVTHLGENSIEAEEVLEFLDKRKKVLDGVVVTGGEPLIQPDIADLLFAIKARGYSIKLDTNGAYPDRLASLISQNLVDYVAMDVKNSPARYAETAGVEVDLTAIERSVALLKEGRVDYEFRTTVAHPLVTIESITELGKWLKGAKRYFLQNFKDSGDLVDGEGLTPFSESEMQELLAAVRPFVPSVQAR